MAEENNIESEAVEPVEGAAPATRDVEGTKRAKMLEGPVTKTILQLTAPMLIALFTMMGFNIVDTYYVAQLGTEQLAAMSFTFAVVMSVQSISMGVGMGTTAVIARVIGEGDTTTVRRLTMDAIMLGIVIALTITVVGLLTINLLFGALGAEGIVLEYVGQYMSIWYLGLALIVVPQVGNSSIRATGDTKTPAMIMISVLLVNIVLDPLLIFGLGPFPELGLQGAALATLTAQGIALIIGVAVLRKRKLLLMIRHSAAEVARLLEAHPQDRGAGRRHTADPAAVHRHHHRHRGGIRRGGCCRLRCRHAARDVRHHRRLWPRQLAPALPRAELGSRPQIPRVRAA